MNLNPEKPRVTAINCQDYPRLVEVWEAAVRATHDFLTEADIQYFKSRLFEFFEGVELVGIRDRLGMVTGFVGVAQGQVEMLFVHPSFQGMGMGRTLLEYAIAHLEATSVDVNEQNLQALGFYCHLGFSVQGRSPLDSMGQPFPLLHLKYQN